MPEGQTYLAYRRLPGQNSKKQYETLSPYRVPHNDKNRSEADMNNHSDIQTSSTQGHTISNISNNQEHTGITEKT